MLLEVGSIGSKMLRSTGRRVELRRKRCFDLPTPLTVTKNGDLDVVLNPNSGYINYVAPAAWFNSVVIPNWTPLSMTASQPNK